MIAPLVFSNVYFINDVFLSFSIFLSTKNKLNILNEIKVTYLCIFLYFGEKINSPKLGNVFLYRELPYAILLVNAKAMKTIP
jgi:hypothetical protein